MTTPPASTTEKGGFITAAHDAVETMLRRAVEHHRAADTPPHAPATVWFEDGLVDAADAHAVWVYCQQLPGCPEDLVQRAAVNGVSFVPSSTVAASVPPGTAGAFIARHIPRETGRIRLPPGPDGPYGLSWQHTDVLTTWARLRELGDDIPGGGPVLFSYPEWMTAEHAQAAFEGIHESGTLHHVDFVKFRDHGVYFVPQEPG